MSWLKHLYFTLLYFRKPPWDTQVSPPELMAFIESHPPGRALDLGCGTGTNVIALAQYGWQVVGVDYVRRAIRAAEQKANQAGVTADFFHGDVTKIENIIGSFDLVLDIGCYHSLDAQERQSYLANLERLTHPGSMFLIYSFLRELGSDRPGMDDKDLSAFRKYFELIKREDGTDRGERPSSWFSYLRK